jgi:hypothetical protein
MIEWETFSAAAEEYSNVCPRVVAYTLTPVIGQVTYTLPSDAIAVRSVGYGVELTLEEVLDSAAPTGWYADGPSLRLTPAPDTTDAIQIVYFARHVPDITSTPSFPTIPAGHLVHVNDLEQAIVLERGAVVGLQAPQKFQIGGITVDSSSATSSVLALVRAIRQRVYAALVTPYATYG